MMTDNAAGQLWTQPLGETLPPTENTAVESSQLDESTCLFVKALDPEPMLEGRDRAWVELDGIALRHNLTVLRKAMTPYQEIMAVLKANAYGHGLEPTADFLSRQGVRHFAVATVEEAKVIRAVNPTAEILILGYGSAAAGGRSITSAAFLNLDQLRSGLSAGSDRFCD